MKEIKILSLLVALILGVAACDNSEALGTKDKNQILVKVDLGKSLPHSRAGGLVELMAGGSAFDVTHLDLYVTNNQTIYKSARVDKANTEMWNALTVGSGLKFLNVPNEATQIIVIANSEKEALAPGKLVKDLEQELTLSIQPKQILGGVGSLKPVGLEPKDAQLAPGESGTVATGTRVKTAQVSLNPIISRFQIVGVELMKKIWDKTKTDTPFEKATEEQRANDDNYKLVPDDDARLVGILLNRFYNKTKLTAGVVGEHSELLQASTYQGNLEYSGETTDYHSTTKWQLQGNDVTGHAAYIGENYVSSGNNKFTANKVAALNIFANNLTKEDVPKIHFVISKKITSGSGETYRLMFANINGYKEASASGPLLTFSNGKLYNINLTRNDKDGVPAMGPIITETEKPGEEDHVSPDISEKDVNVTAKVQVADWLVENIKPVFE